MMQDMTKQPESLTPVTPAQEPQTLVSAKGVKTHFPVKSRGLRRTVGHVRAVDGIDLDIQAGETLGLVGESGCGKSTLGRTLVRLVDATAGRIDFDGMNITQLSLKQLKPIRREMQLIQQDPVSSLNPRMTVSQIVGEGLIIHGVSRREREQRVHDILEAVGLDPTITSRYPHEFSGGQRQRIGIARALVMGARFVVADEAVSSLDVSIQAQVLNLLVELRQRFSLTFLFIAHNLAVVDYIADRVGVMYLGKIVELADTDDLRTNPQHPYTVALLSAIPDAAGDGDMRRIVLPGDVPNPMDPPSGCRFRTRCPIAQPICAEVEPPLEAKSTGHRVACHFAGEMIV